MTPLKYVGLGVTLIVGFVCLVGSARAQSVSDSAFKNELMVLEVRGDAGRVVCIDQVFARKAIRVHKGTTVITEDGQTGDLQLLSVGDVIKVEGKAGRADKIVRVRRASEVTASPEQ